MPSIVNRGGVEPPLDVPMSDAERAGLATSGATVRASLALLGF